LEDLDIDVWGH